jgi:hypothetical protein
MLFQRGQREAKRTLKATSSFAKDVGNKISRTKIEKSRSPLKKNRRQGKDLRWTVWTYRRSESAMN